jgi:LacI family transcriptional regulator
MVTAKAIAEAARVSRSTAQRALSGDPKVSSETRARVREIAATFGYRPNRHARALVMRQQKLEYAAILTVPENVFMQEVLKGVNHAQDELKDSGVNVAVRFMDAIDGPMQAELINRLVEAGTRGIVFISIDCPEVRRAIANGVRKGTTFVSMVTDIRHSRRISFVGQDNTRSGRVAGGLMGVLLKPGEKVACFVGSTQFTAHMERLSGFRERFLDSHCVGDIVSVVENFDSAVFSDKLTGEVLAAHPDLRGIFIAGAGVDGVCAHITRRGLGGKIRMVTFDLVQSAEYCRDGVIDFVIDQGPVQEGYRALMVLNSYVMYGEIPEEKLFTTIDIRTRDNVEM